jgi:tetratricopeptide (TPR) repeat protein
VLECVARALEMEPRFFPSHWFAGLAYEQLGRFDEAVAELQQARTLSNDSTNMTTSLAGVYAVAGRHELARGLLAELDDLATRKYVSPVFLAQAYAPLGEIERALTLLEHAFEDRDPRAVFIKTDPRVDRLRGEPRFERLVARLGLSAPRDGGQ